jgi:hypothetical protein
MARIGIAFSLLGFRSQAAPVRPGAQGQAPKPCSSFTAREIHDTIGIEGGVMDSDADIERLAGATIGLAALWLLSQQRAMPFPGPGDAMHAEEIWRWLSSQFAGDKALAAFESNPGSEQATSPLKEELLGLLKHSVSFVYYLQKLIEPTKEDSGLAGLVGRVSQALSFANNLTKAFK